MQLCESLCTKCVSVFLLMSSEGLYIYKKIKSNPSASLSVERYTFDISIPPFVSEPVCPDLALYFINKPVPMHHIPYGTLRLSGVEVQIIKNRWQGKLIMGPKNEVSSLCCKQKDIIPKSKKHYECDCYDCGALRSHCSGWHPPCVCGCVCIFQHSQPCPIQ